MFRQGSAHSLHGGDWEPSVRLWLRKYLGLCGVHESIADGADHATQLVYSDALGLELPSSVRGSRIYRVPSAQPTRSWRFACGIKRLFEQVTGDTLPEPRGFRGNASEWSRDTIRAGQNLVILGSDIANSLFRDLFGDTRGGTAQREFRKRVRDARGLVAGWGAQLPLIFVTDLLSGSRVQEDASYFVWHSEPLRGFSTDELLRPLFAADFPHFKAAPIGDFIITKLASPPAMFRQEKVLSINGIHGEGAMAARQLFAFGERQDCALELSIIVAMMGCIDELDTASWQMAIRADEFDHTDKLFRRMRILTCRRIQTKWVTSF